MGDGGVSRERLLTLAGRRGRVGWSMFLIIGEEVEEVEGGGVEVVEEEVGDGWSEGGVGGERRRSQKAKLRR